jgi:adenylate cyclase
MDPSGFEVADPAGWPSGAPAPADEAGLVAALGHRLRDAGLPVDRLILHQRTLHPDILARAIAWAPDEPLELYDRDHGLDLSANFAGSPLQQAMETGMAATVRLDGNAPKPAWAWSRALCRRDLVELVVLPLGTADGPVAAITLGTARPCGFAASDRTVLERIMPAVIARYEAMVGTAA